MIDKTSTAPVMALQDRTKCPECGGKCEWFIHIRNNSQVVDGRLKTSDVTCHFVLGCEECSETIKVCAAEEIAIAMNNAPTPDVVGSFSEADVARCEIAMVKASAPDTGTDLEFNKACVRAILAEFTRARVADVVGGDVVAFRFVRADGHKYTWVDASEMARNGRPEDVLAEGERIEYAYAAQRAQGDADHSVDLRQELKDMVRAYIRLLEVGRDRIVDLGGSCDPLDVMEQGDANLIRAKRALAAQPKVDASHPAEQTRGDGVTTIPEQSRAALLWLLWHHQGGSSQVGQPIRQILGLGTHERMSEEQIAVAKAFSARIATPRQAVPDELIADLRKFHEETEACDEFDLSNEATAALLAANLIEGTHFVLTTKGEAMLDAAPSAGRMGVDT